MLKTSNDYLSCFLKNPFIVPVQIKESQPSGYSIVLSQENGVHNSQTGNVINPKITCWKTIGLYLRVHGYNDIVKRDEAYLMSCRLHACDPKIINSVLGIKNYNLTSSIL